MKMLRRKICEVGITYLLPVLSEMGVSTKFFKVAKTS